MTNNINPIDATRLINFLTTCDCANQNPIRPDCRHDLRARDLRSLLIDATDDRLESDCAELLRDTIMTLTASPYHRDELSQLRLADSLCPLHCIDYAICFDDDDPDCAAIRIAFPSHDT